MTAAVRVGAQMERLRREFEADSCPACGGGKRARQAFCLRCYLALPLQTQMDLHSGNAAVYAGAVMDAKEALRAQADAQAAEASE